jgi:pimeloyl-ACP methyl ester carboxylesterase
MNPILPYPKRFPDYALVKRVVTLGLGLSFFGLVAAIHVISTTGAKSVPFLVALWIFTPAPAVFLWSWSSRHKNWSRTQKASVVSYLSLATLLALVVPAVVGWIATERALHPAVCEAGNRSLANYPDIQLAAELVSFPVPEGGRRVGWFIPGRSQAPVILLHGFGCQRQEMLEYAQVLHQAGYSTLLFDFRGRGDSDGDAVTLGFYEQQDVLAAVEYLRSRDDVDIGRVGALGISMGGAVAILAAAQEPAIRTVVADSPFESAEQAIEEGFTRVVGLPAFPFAPITLQFIKWRLGASPDGVIPRDYIAAISPRPILIIHGLADTAVSSANSESLFAAALDPKELWLLPGVNHTNGIGDLKEEYSHRVINFFGQNLN